MLTRTNVNDMGDLFVYPVIDPAKPLMTLASEGELVVAHDTTLPALARLRFRILDDEDETIEIDAFEGCDQSLAIALVEDFLDQLRHAVECIPENASRMSIPETLGFYFVSV